MKDIKYMKEALVEANKAYKLGEIPVGAVVVLNDEIIGRGHNLKETKNDVTQHAEIVAIRKASQVVNNWRLSDCTIYITLEPCAMCASAIKQSRISRVVYALDDNTQGAVVSSQHILENTGNSDILVCNNVMNKEAKELMNKFFEKSRSN